MSYMIIVEWALMILLVLVTLIDSNKKRLIFYLLTAIHMSVPLIILKAGQDSGIFALDIVQITALMKVMFLSRGAKAGNKDSVKGPLLLLSVYIILVGPLASLISGINDQFANAMFWGIRFFMYYLLYYTGAKIARIGISYKALAKINLLAALPVLVLGAVHYSGFADLNFFRVGVDEHLRVHQGILGHSRASMGLMLMTVYFLGLVVLGSNVSIRWKVFATLVSLVSLVECMYSYSRSALLGALLGSALICVSSRKVKYLLVFIPIAVVGIYVIQNVQGFKERFAPEKQQSNYSAYNKLTAGRLEGWQNAIDGIKEVPLAAVLGFGLRSFRTVMEHKRVMMHSGHNVFLQVFVELGLIGLAIFLVLQILILRQLWRKFRAFRLANNSEMAWGGLIILSLFVAVILSSFTQENMYPAYAMHPFNIYLFFLLGIMSNVPDSVCIERSNLKI